MIAYEHTFPKLVPLLLLSTTTLVSALLVAYRDKRSIGEFNNFVRANRDTIALVIQILSSILGLCSVYSVCAVVNFSTRLHLKKHGVTLQTLHLWSLIVNLRLDFSLPKPVLFSLLFWCIFTRIPGAIWAGALTPLFVDILKDSGYISVPSYSASSSTHWGEFTQQTNGQVNRNMPCVKTVDPDFKDWDGPFLTTCPDLDFTSSLQASAGAATKTAPDKSWIHSNMVVKDWSFIGRSYGVGSSPGLLDPSVVKPVPFYAYNFTEYGYFTKVNCERNESATYRVDRLGVYGTGNVNVGIWTTNGSLPNSVPGLNEVYVLATHGGSGDHNIFALSSVVNNGKNMIAVATPPSSWYENFDKMQCTVTFQPSLFTIAANLTSQTITVTRPSELQHQEITDIESTGKITANVMYSLDRLSRINNNFEISALGNAISWNRANVQNAYPELSTEESYIRGLEDSLTAILDDLLFAYAGSQQVISKARIQTPFSGSYVALRIGSDKYIFAIFGINVILWIVLAAELARTRFWNGLGGFNYTDVKSVIVAASAGGKGIADTAETPDPDASALEIKNHRDQAESALGKVFVELLETETGVALTKGNSTREGIEYDSGTSFIRQHKRNR